MQMHTRTKHAKTQILARMTRTYAYAITQSHSVVDVFFFSLSFNTAAHKRQEPSEAVVGPSHAIFFLESIRNSD